MHCGTEEMANDGYARFAVAGQPAAGFLRLPDPVGQKGGLAVASRRIDDGDAVWVGGDEAVQALHRLLPTDEALLPLLLQELASRVV
jgi:hypothetical protein